jgi:dethiobiotin synthetase
MHNATVVSSVTRQEMTLKMQLNDRALRSQSAREKKGKQQEMLVDGVGCLCSPLTRRPRHNETLQWQLLEPPIDRRPRRKQNDNFQER